MRSDTKRPFPLENQEKKAQRCALRAPHYNSTAFHGARPGLAREKHRPLHGLGGAAHVDAHISWAAARPGPSDCEMMGRRRIRLREDRPGPSNALDAGPRPGPAHNVSIFHGPARPGPPIFQSSRPGPARRGLSHFQQTRPGPAGPGLSAHDKSPEQCHVLRRQC